ncbi:hypothetical protein [Fimbriimonas ginsengisoli]|uniref:Glycoside hydrolase family 42 N-terminal domain-containing protein n=1 Tax=Fimbriimonas ginsengisoli Gsoil 348 TaxID=661478 RepID=A0A068NNB0_FIMGI|nr:hypothetical protein [Fimbriimonas ginsengisoli]AIE84235.1 hypothetical protein OP10G_0867 [Fimbriimonas ginsengisoli Gsoil 348]
MLPLLVALAIQTWGGPDTWAFAPPPDDFRSDAMLDLRYLNEKVAGESGYVTADDKGDFRLGNGKPVRFWAVNSGVGRDVPFHPRPLGRQTEPDLARHARFLAKRGVNMTRLHAQLSPDLGKHPDAKITDVNVEERDWIWRSVAAMKKEGIYTTISPYWMVPMKFSKAWGIPGGADQSAAGLLFFDRTLQTGYRAWLRALLSEKNPYTGIPLAKDPSVALLELQNEDSLLFWTFGNIKGPQKHALGARFGEFLVKRYGSVQKTITAWQGEKLPEDDSAAGVFDFYGLWEVPNQLSAGKSQRLGDQIEFLTETMRQFNKETADFIRNELGCKALVNAGNWRTADPTRLQDAERYSYLPTEVDAVNKYFSGIHKGPNEGWAIVNGDKFTSPSLLLDPRPGPFNLKQTHGRPIVVTESSWVMPAGYSSEGPLMTAAYQSLTGVDAYYWFATGDDEWSQPGSANGYTPSQTKWLFANPDMLGTFPAAALMFRSGYVKRGTPAVYEVRRPADIWKRRTPIISEEPGFDPNRDSKDVVPGMPVTSGVNPLAFLVGPVEVAFGDDPAKSRVDYSKYIDAGTSTVRSNTGELALNNDKGFCTIDTPSAQGVAAFFGKHPAFKLSDVTFISRNDYGAAAAVSMDGKPLRESSKILLQFGTRSRPTGWQEKETTIDLGGGKSTPGLEVVSFGKAPWQVVNADLEIAIHNPSITRASVLDMNGNAIGVVPLKREGEIVRLTFPKNAMYVILGR